MARGEKILLFSLTSSPSFIASLVSPKQSDDGVGGNDRLPPEGGKLKRRKGLPFLCMTIWPLSGGPETVFLMRMWAGEQSSLSPEATPLLAVSVKKGNYNR